MTYTLTSSANIIRDADQAVVPADPMNADYQAYLAWLAVPNTPAPYTPPPVSLVQAAEALLAQGIAVTSTSVPAFSATFSLSEASQSNYTAVDFYVSKNGAFPQGAATTAWQDINGVIQTFPSVAVFSDFANKVADYVDNIENFIDSNGTVGALPTSNKVTII